jgi:Pyrimidine dimer DNA glycosylase
MQTFLPYDDFYKTAQVLDWRRLGKQRVEAKQVLLTIDRGDEAGGWKNHPAVNMWRGYEEALALYGAVICLEWVERGYNDTQLGWFRERIPNSVIELPPWLGDEQFHLGHQSNLIRKLPEHYGPIFEGVPDDVPYYWPDQRTVTVL